MNILQCKGQYEEERHESPLLKTTCCYPADSSQMNQKIETASTVLSQYLGVSTSYKYDAKGHLVESDMCTCHEDYTYNSIG